MLIHARGRMFHLERFAIQMLSSSGVGAFFIVIPWILERLRERRGLGVRVSYSLLPLDVRGELVLLWLSKLLLRRTEILLWGNLYCVVPVGVKGGNLHGPLQPPALVQVREHAGPPGSVLFYVGNDDTYSSKRTGAGVHNIM